MLREPPLRGVHLLANPRHRGRMPYPARLLPLFNAEAGDAAFREISSWPGYEPTPLRGLHGLAADLGVGAIHYKDEAGRFGLESFKALGGAYAVMRLLQRLVGEGTASGFEALAAAVRQSGASFTVCCATDGNHGRSVAWGAQLFGIRSCIFLHEGVSAAREGAISRYGAEIIRVPGTYDDSVREAERQAREKGWYVVSDTSYPGYRDVPLDVMQGYTVMVEEALRQLVSPPTHIFVQGGVGGLAAAVAAHTWLRLGYAYPGVTVVEPDQAPCLYLTARAGHPVAVDGPLDTIMAGLACGEVSEIAWEVLEPAASHFMTIEETDAVEAMKVLARDDVDGGGIIAGESGAAGVAGLTAATTRDSLRRTLRLGPDSRVLVFGTEGATDPESYARLLAGESGQARHQA